MPLRGVLCAASNVVGAFEQIEGVSLPLPAVLLWHASHAEADLAVQPMFLCLHVLLSCATFVLTHCTTPTRALGLALVL